VQSIDGAYEEEEENDHSARTTWGVFDIFHADKAPILEALIKGKRRRDVQRYHAIRVEAWRGKVPFSTFKKVALDGYKHQWLEQLLRGEMSSLRMIAAAAGKSERYVSKLIRTAFLAPDLVEAVLDGRAPTRLTLAELTDDLPWDWNEQRRRFARLLGASERLSARSQRPCNP